MGHLTCVKGNRPAKMETAPIAQADPFHVLPMKGE
jgi:hypothetical protein